MARAQKFLTCQMEMVYSRTQVAWPQQHLSFTLKSGSYLHSCHLMQNYLFNGESQDFRATWHKELTHWKRLWCQERLRAGGEGGDRGWDGWIVDESPTQWTRIWANSARQWTTVKPGVLQFMGLSSLTGLNMMCNGFQQLFNLSTC